MIHPRTKLAAYLRLARVSNLPTCWSNVLVGAAAGVWAEGGSLADARGSWGAIVAAMGAVSLLYVGGMILNDAADVEVDCVERPGRPIPSGKVALGEAYALAISCFALGLVIATMLGSVALGLGAALAGCIIAYDFLNKRLPGLAAAVLMGVCRGMVYLFAAAAVSDSPAWGVVGSLAVLLTLYTAIITVIARRETGLSIDARKWLALLMPVIALAGGVFAQPHQMRHALLMGVVMTFWLGYAAWQVLRPGPRITAAVLAWLAGMSLVDAYFLTLMDRRLEMAAAIGCFVLTKLLHRRVAGT